MNCRILTIALMLSLLPQAIHASPPRPSLRINILSKYRLNDIIIKSQGRVSLASETIEPDNGTISVSCSGNKIRIMLNGKIYIEESVKIYLSRDSKNSFININYTGRSRKYSGLIEIQNKAGSLQIINETPVEDYVHSAAIAELGDITAGLKPAECRELISAMEIAIRSYSLHNKGRHRDPAYELCDLTHCIYYAGIIGGHSLTPGCVLTGSDGKILNAFFHSTCGGILTRPEICWNGPSQKNYRNGKDIFDDKILCKNSPHYEWNAKIDNKDICAILGTARFRNLTAEYSGGRVTALRFKTDTGENRTGIAQFMSSAGKRLGWNVIKSNLFSVSRELFSPVFTFKGRGLGHGVGLCQWGSRELAGQGKTCEEILYFYYPEAKIEDWNAVREE